MAEKVTPNDLIKSSYEWEEDYTCDIVEKDEPIDTMWGASCVKITAEDIKALQSGKCLYVTDDEYATILYMGE